MHDFKNQLKIAYNADASRRDDADGKRDQWKLDVRQQFVDLLKAENKTTVLELGSGAGIDAKYFQDQGLTVLATDLSDEMVKMCEKRGVKACVMDLYNIPALKKSFDAIYSLNVLLHVPKKDLRMVLAHIYNTLNTNGIFFYGVYGGRDEEKIITDTSKMNLPRLFSFLSDETLRQVVESKFEVIDFQPISIGNDKPGLHFQSLFLRKK